MRGWSRGVTLTLCVALALLFLIPTIPLADASPSTGPKSASQSELQYDPSLLFRNGTVFNEYASSFLAPTGMVDFQMGDMNDDGLKDIVAVNSTAILIYNRSADGDFNHTPWKITKSGMMGIRSVAIGDLFGSGKNDIVVSNLDSIDSPFITIFKHDDSFNPATAITSPLVPSDPYDVLIGHFSYTTNNSIAVVCGGVPNCVNIWSYPFAKLGSRLLVPIGNLTNSDCLAAADIDNNGLTDLVVGQKGESTVQIVKFLSHSSYKQKGKSIPGSATAGLELKDMDGDGRADILRADSADSQIEVYLYNQTTNDFNNDSQAFLHVQNGISFFEVGTVAAASANAIMALSKDSSNLSVSFKRAGGWYGGWPDIYVPVNENPVRVMVDRSILGKELLIVLSSGRTSSDGSFELFPVASNLSGNSDRTVFFGSNEVGKMATGLIDGHKIVATVLPSTDEVVLYNATTGWMKTLATGVGLEDVIFGRFDGDAYDDLAVLNTGSRTISVYTDERLLSGTTPSVTVFYNMTGASCLAKASVRGNLYDDLLVGSQNGVKILYNTLDASLFRSDLNETLGGGLAGTITDIAFAEFNGNGHPYDVAALNSDNSAIELFFRAASGWPGDYYPDAPSQTITGPAFTRMAMGDFGGNSWMDLAVLNATGYLLVYQQSSPNGFLMAPGSPSATIHLQDVGATIAVGNINDDELDDLVIGFRQLPEVACYLRTGDLAFKNSFNWTSGGITADIHADDVTDDLRSDVICSAPDSHSLSMWFQHNLVPWANATASAYIAPEGQQTTFSGTGSRDSFSDQSSLSYQWSFNSSYNPTGATVYGTFLDNGTYHVSLRVTDRGGLSNWSNLTILVTDLDPTASFVFYPTSPIEGTVAYFNDTSTSYPDSIVAWNWSFGDNGFSTSRNAMHTYQQNGVYSVRLRVWDDDGGMSEVTKLVNVQDTSPSAAFTFAPPSILEGTSFTFTDNSTSPHDPIVSWAWEFGDGGVGSGQSAQHIYVQDGTFTVNLTVTDSDGSTDSVSHDVVVGDIAPIANFTCSTTSPIEGTEVQFNDTTYSYDGVVTWYWDFDDGSTSPLRDVSHSFAWNRSAPYLVELTVTEADGNSSKKTIPITVLDSIPSVDFICSPKNLTEGLVVAFQDNSSAHDELVSWTWHFGDGNQSTEQNAAHTYAKSGSYLVVLTVEDNDSSVNSTSRWIDVADSIPIVNFTTAPGLAIEGSPVWFNDTSTAYDGLVSWTWDFGDGYQSTEQNATHTYPNDGRYLVVLTVVDNDSSVNSTSRWMNIADTTPTADFTIAPSLAIEGNTVWFNDTSTAYDGLVSWTWDFGDGYQSTEQNATHTYAKSGSYNVELEVQDSDGSFANATRTVLVLDIPPAAGFTAQPNPQYEGSAVWFNDTSSHYDPLSSWYWDFGDGNQSTEQNAAHTYMRNGNYVATLTVWDSDRVSNYTTKTILILDCSPTASFYCHPTQPREGAQAYFNDTSTSPVDAIQNWTWDFGDGYSGYGMNVMHAFNRSGDFIVLLKVTDSDRSIDSTSLLVHVVNVDPFASFTFLPTSPDEREPVSFFGHATTLNTIVSWSWDFGDGNTSAAQNPMHTYQKNGTYSVSLTVVELDGSSNAATHQISILETGPTINRVTLFPTKQTYNEDELFQVYVDAVKAAYDITYHFDFHYDGTFTEDAETELNHTSFSYPQKGTYHIMVRVFDDDGFAQASTYIVIEIVNVPPSAQFTFREMGSQKIGFDATGSSDTPSDIATLEFSWNFDDGSGFTAYSMSAITNHAFVDDGVYNVTLRVMDDDGRVATTYRAVAVNPTALLVTLEDAIGVANVGQTITVSVNVSDSIGVSSVMLHYRIDNGTEQIKPMTPHGSPNNYNYEAEIPGVDHTATITYWIVATDNAQNVYITGQYSISVVNGDIALIWTFTIIVLVALVAFLYVRITRAAVDEVFIIYEDGRLIAHQTRRLKPGMDDDILSSMLSAIQSFVKDSFKDERATQLQRLDFGEKKILIEKGDHFFIAVVLHGKRPGATPRKLRQVIDSIQTKHGEALAAWNGDLESLRGVKDLTAPLFGGETIQQMEKPQAEECAACGSPIGPDDKLCPSCGASLQGGELDDLEAVASDLSEKKD